MYGITSLLGRERTCTSKLYYEATLKKHSMLLWARGTFKKDIPFSHSMISLTS